MKEIETSWIETGYRFFAYEGPVGLKVERLSKQVGKNKSSFYHLFADLEVFTERLLNFHFHQAQIIAEKESACTSEKELITILLEHKTDLLFNCQLRIHRENSDFHHYVDKINQITIPAILPIWSKLIGLSDNSYLAQMVLNLSLENFNLQISDSTLNEEWLSSYFRGIRNMVSQFKQNQGLPALDANV